MTTLRKILDLLDARERRQAYLLVPLVILMALAEVGGIASIAPFLSLMADPEAAREVAVLAWAYDTFGFQTDRAFLVAVGVAVIGVLVVANGILIAGNWILFRFGAMRNHSISHRLLVRYLQQPYSFFLTRNTAALANNILAEVQQVINGIVLPGLQVIARAVAALAILAFLVVLDPLLASFVVVVLGGAYGAIFWATRRYLRRVGHARVVANQERYRAANEAMGGIKDLRLLGREGHMASRYARPSYRFARFMSNAKIIGEVPRYAIEAVAFGGVVVIVLILLAGGRSVTEVLPTLGLYAFAGYRLMPALQRVFTGATQIRFSQGALDEVHEMVGLVGARSADSDDFEDRSTIQPIRFEDEVRFERLGFAYPGTAPVLHEVDVTIRKNESVAFVGSTGAGKTTLVDLLLGLLEPTAGRITVDGTPLDRETLPAWQSRIGYVPQSIFLTDDTIERNIAFGLADRAIDHDRVRAAARLAQVAAFIEEDLANAYETVVGERGVRLSGGQRQRIGIARALYHDPDVLVFDEATSALDGSTERAVYEAIRALSGTKTIVTIAHRLGTVRDADVIYLLEKGRVTAQGRFDQLLASSPAFRRMAQASDALIGVGVADASTSADPAT